MVFGAALPTITILATVWLGGVFPDFWASYIIANLGYAGSFTLAKGGARLMQLLRSSELNGLMAGVAALAVFSLVKSRMSRPAAPAGDSWIKSFAWLYLGVAVFSCIRPPHGFVHYHLFLIGPLLVALGMLGRTAWPVGPPNPGDRLLRWPGMVAAICLLGPVGALSAYHYGANAQLREYLVTRRREADQRLPAVVAREIKHRAPGASTLVVWGWMPTLYLQSGLHSATRHTISHFLIDAGPQRDFLRRQFLQDVRAARPDVIIDAVSSDCFTWYWPVASSGLESFPEFAAYVWGNYHLVLSVTSDQAGVPLRVFVRKPPDGPRS